MRQDPPFFYEPMLMRIQSTQAICGNNRYLFPEHVRSIVFSTMNSLDKESMDRGCDEAGAGE